MNGKIHKALIHWDYDSPFFIFLFFLHSFVWWQRSRNICTVCTKVKLKGKVVPVHSMNA